MLQYAVVEMRAAADLTRALLFVQIIICRAQCGRSAADHLTLPSYALPITECRPASWLRALSAKHGHDRIACRRYTD
ncbi:hypothetical protein HYPSUDRAFT_677978 [Hypholoma sublateritium FD-334 SS-4]|uniref:Uncharacterized protein n=1 Tax=Hypholoma sublateritium (strain FD-334 SS-4) TaxID=945553 RepID=A0A0D2NSE0_HYPSF|nr:hypothetical protein HYPSUDRAFT_677978 [Hypholoma sublateritium FD-334 SS-4]